MKYVLIIGAGSDIGYPLAELYCKHGYGVYLASRNVDMLKRNAQDLSIRYHTDCKAYILDITDTETHNSFYEKLEPKPLGVIVLAGLLGDQSISEKDHKEAMKVISTNYTGIVSFLHIVANDFENRKSGFIVGVSSVAGERGRKSNYVYGSSKAAMTAFLSGLRNRLNSAQVQVLTVHPGFIRTKMIEGKKTSPLLTATPRQVANDIFNGQQKGKDFIYSRWFWRYIMMIFRMIPERIAKTLDLR